MHLLDGELIHGATDLVVATGCEFDLLVRLDELLGRRPRLEVEQDAMLARTAELGEAHEKRYLRSLQEQLGPGRIVSVPTAAPGSREALTAAAAMTRQALLDGADVVYQASFFDGSFHGRADFLERAADGRYTVVDTKLARTARVPALLQLAAYADQLERWQIPLTPYATLVLGNGDRVEYLLTDLLPVFHRQRDRLSDLLQEHRNDSGPARWGDSRACGRCDRCQEQLSAHRDLLMVAGMRVTTRDRLLDAGVGSIDELAIADPQEPVPGVSADTWQRLVRQAGLQVQQSPPTGDPGPIVHEIFDMAGLLDLPPADPGDIFFDFEGDPLWAESGSSDWGLEYLFGVIEAPIGDADPVFRPFWAHSRAEESQALRDFLDYLAERRRAHPGMHVYHYAPYERTALNRLAVRHGHGEEAVNDLLRAGVLVDLYATVRRSVAISQPSYSLKKLEPLYLDVERSGEVTSGGDSIEQYHRFSEARRSGDHAGAAALLAEIAEYNRVDCLSTWQLTGWLRSHLPAGSARTPFADDIAVEATVLSDRVLATVESSDRLRALLGDHHRTPDDESLALLAAAPGYYQREERPFWWEHFSRLQAPVGDWGSGAHFLPTSVELVTDWHRSGRQRKDRRHLRLSGPAPEQIPSGGGWHALYEPPLPIGLTESATGFRAANGNVTVQDHEQTIDTDGQAMVALLVEEMAGKEGAFAAYPMALTPPPPIPVASLESAIRELADQVAHSHPLWPASAAVDLLLRRPPRPRDGRPLTPVAEGDHTTAIVDSLTRLDTGFLAVQGPPGTGKTYVGGHVIAALAERGWRIGVVAQSHEVVENMLAAVVRAGAPKEKVGKRHQSSVPMTWTEVEPDNIAAFLAQEGGVVVGGTAWDFSNTKRVGRESLDLLVIDEAGQFGLAGSLAVAVSASRLLLLGDPQQLPQVVQGIHTEPIDRSALTHLARGAATLPAEYGYFLDTSWRMHPEICRAVSDLSYAGRLHSRTEVTTDRELSGVQPGIGVVWIEHHVNRISSVEEAEAIRDQITELIGRRWRDGESSHALTPADVMVVTPYNAQVALVRRVLADAGLAEVRVGTVDKFQGQQAPVVFISMCVSSPQDVSRGMGFLLSRNRLNVAISRAQWRAVIVRSPALTDHLPTNADSLLDLGAFIGLCGG